MAVKLKNLEQIAKTFTEQTFLFKDLSLDLRQSSTIAPGFTLPVPGSDVRASFDIEAIKNSLQNLINTRPGQRFLFPNFGINLERFIFQPITRGNGNIIGNLIYTTINKYEPRVQVDNVQVIIDPDNNQYIINILLNIPQLNIQVPLESIFNTNKQSFIVLPQTTQ